MITLAQTKRSAADADATGEATTDEAAPNTKQCRVCGAENPVAARECSECRYTFPDDEG